MTQKSNNLIDELKNKFYEKAKPAKGNELLKKDTKK